MAAEMIAFGGAQHILLDPQKARQSERDPFEEEETEDYYDEVDAEAEAQGF